MKFEEKTESSRKPSSASTSELEAEEFHDDFAEALEDIDLDELLAMADDDTASNASSKGLFNEKWKKNIRKKFGWKTRENVLQFLALVNFDFTRIFFSIFSNFFFVGKIRKNFAVLSF